MPEFILDTNGCVEGPWPTFTRRDRFWTDLDAFTQGYIEALLASDWEELADALREHSYVSQGLDYSDAKPWPMKQYAPGFSNLAPETLAAIMRDCAAFQASEAWATYEKYGKERGWPRILEKVAEMAGRDFWYTRNGHGCGFWDGDWPEPYATQLTDAAKAFGGCDACLGDDGKVYFL